MSWSNSQRPVLSFQRKDTLIIQNCKMHMLQSAEQSLWAEGWSATFSSTALIFLPKNNRISDHQKNPNVSFVSKMSFVLTYFSKENIKSWKVNLKENCQPRAPATYLGKTRPLAQITPSPPPCHSDHLKHHSVMPFGIFFAKGMDTFTRHGYWYNLCE